MIADRKIEYSSYTLVYAAAVLAAKAHLDYVTAVLLMAEAMFLFIWNFRKTKNLVDMRGLFTLAWVGGEGIACLKLSRLQSDWSNVTWLTFFLIYVCFNLGYDLWLGRFSKEQRQEVKRDEYLGKADSDLHLRTDGSFHCMFYVGGSGGRLYSIVQFSASCIFLFSYFGSALFYNQLHFDSGTDCIVYQGYRKNFGQDMDTFNCRKPDGSGDSYFMCLQISAVVCGWLCGSDVSDVV